MLPELELETLTRLRTVRGHLDGIIRMVEDGGYCVDLMKQVSAAQSSLEKVNRLILRNHLQTCFSEALLDGRGEAAIAEVIDAVKFTAALTGPDAVLAGHAIGETHVETQAIRKARNSRAAPPRPE